MRLVDADKLFHEFEVSAWYNNADRDEVAEEILLNAPTIDAVPVVHGHWINAYPDIEPNPMFMYGICSVCSFEQSISDKLKYCPNCGAKMDLIQEDNNDKNRNYLHL